MPDSRTLRVLLMADSDETPLPWSLTRLREQLEEQGHDVRVTAGPDVPDDVDLVHAFGWDAARRAAASGAPWVLTVDEPDDGDDVAQLANAAQRVLAPSGRHAKDVNRLGVPNYRITVMPVGVDCDTYTRTGPMAKRTERFRLVTPVSDASAGLLAAVELLRLAEDTELVALSEEEPAALPDEVEEVALAAGVRPRIAAVTAVDPRERAWWLRSGHAAVVLDPEQAEPAFVAEAMSCGTAVVATPVDEQSELVVHGVTGFHVPPGASLSAARALRVILADDFSRDAYGMAAADRATSRLCWPRVAADFAAVYRSVAPEDDAGSMDATDVERDVVEPAAS